MGISLLAEWHLIQRVSESESLDEKRPMGSPLQDELLTFSGQNPLACILPLKEKLGFIWMFLAAKIVVVKKLL